MQTDVLAAASSAVAEAASEAVSGASAMAAPTGLALVLQKIEWFIMVPGVYLAFLGFLVFSIHAILRIFRAPRPAYQLAIYPAPRRPTLAALGDAFAMPQIRRRAPLFWFFLAIYHLGFLLLVLGHLDILPEIDILPASSRHMLGAGAVGLMVTVPTFYFIGRRFRSPVREISSPGDYLLLLLLLFTFLFGDLMSWGNSWTTNGFVMTKADFGRYFEALLRFTFDDPRTFLHGSHYHFAVIHVLLAELILLALPFTKIVHAFFALPINLLRRRVWTRS